MPELKCSEPIRRLAYLTLFCLGLALGLGARAAESSREVRDLSSPFDKVQLSGPIDLVLVQGQTNSLVLEADPRLLSYVKTQVRDGVLEVRYEGVHISLLHSSSGPRAILTVPRLRRISSAGSGDIRCETWTSPDDLEVSIAGSGEIRMSGLTVPKIAVRIAGNGDIELAGSVPEQEIHISGAGDYNGESLKSARAAIGIAGAGDAVVWATDTLSVNLAGAGEVKYYGHPVLNRSVAGVGDVHSLGDKP
ncbi:MAG: head GIN domain-containing protein [Burkholderiaceae bacterium]|jgi:hypothetical protein